MKIPNSRSPSRPVSHNGVDSDEQLEALAALAKAFPRASDAVDRCTCAYILTPALVHAAESALAEAERLDAMIGNNIARRHVQMDRAIFELRLNGASQEEIYDYISRIEYL